MRNAKEADEWRIHQLSSGDHSAASGDLTVALRDLCEGGDVHAGQTVRAELVDGMRHERMLQRIRERLNTTLAPAHRRYTRRAWLELQGRHHADQRPRMAIERN